MICWRRRKTQTHFEGFVVMRFDAEAWHPAIDHQIDIRTIWSLATGERFGRIEQQRFQIVDNTLYQLKGYIARFGNVDIRRCLAQFHTSYCRRFSRLFRRCMGSQSLLDSFNKMFLLEVARWTRRSSIGIHNLFQNFLYTQRRSRKRNWNWFWDERTRNVKLTGLSTSNRIWKGQTAARLFLFSEYDSRISKNVSQHLQPKWERKDRKLDESTTYSSRSFTYFDNSSFWFRCNSANSCGWYSIQFHNAFSREFNNTKWAGFFNKRNFWFVSAKATQH